MRDVVDNQEEIGDLEQQMRQLVFAEFKKVAEYIISKLTDENTMVQEFKTIRAEMEYL
jgi:hypothetical protein